LNNLGGYGRNWRILEVLEYIGGCWKILEGAGVYWRSRKYLRKSEEM